MYITIYVSRVECLLYRESVSEFALHETAYRVDAHKKPRRKHTKYNGLSLSSPIGSSRRPVDVCRKVSPTWLLVRQSQVIIVQIEPLERVHSNHNVTQRGVRPLHLEALVQVRCDGCLVVIIKLIQVLLGHRSL